VQEILFAGLVSNRHQECISWSPFNLCEIMVPWSKNFLQRCAEAGSIDASFMLGMVSQLVYSEIFLLAPYFFIRAGT
jgi:hypothetical protein